MKPETYKINYDGDMPIPINYAAKKSHIVNNPKTSFWLQEQINRLEKVQVDDAINQIEILLELQKLRLEESK